MRFGNTFRVKDSLIDIVHADLKSQRTCLISHKKSLWQKIKDWFENSPWSWVCLVWTMLIIVIWIKL